MIEFAVNLYQGRRHLLTEYFESETAALFYFKHVAISAGQSAHLMQLVARYKWKEIGSRVRGVPHEQQLNRIPL